MQISERLIDSHFSKTRIERLHELNNKIGVFHAAAIPLEPTTKSFDERDLWARASLQKRLVHTLEDCTSFQLASKWISKAFNAWRF